MTFFEKMHATMSVWVEKSKPKINELKKLAKRIGAATHAGVDEVLVFIQVNILPELVVFIKDNLALAMRVVFDIAKQYAENPNVSGSFKRELARDKIVENIPNIQYQSYWIQLLIEIAVAILKNKKVI